MALVTTNLFLFNINENENKKKEDIGEVPGIMAQQLSAYRQKFSFYFKGMFVILLLDKESLWKGRFGHFIGSQIIVGT